MRSIVEQYWSAVARRLQEEVETFNKLIGHSGEQGRENELSLARLLENLLPASVGVGSGMLIDSQGGISKQTDIVIYDSANQPSVLAQTTQAIYPVENVLLTIEVKTTLNEEELQDCAKKHDAQMALRPADGRPVPPMAVLAYNVEGMLSTAAARIRSVPSDSRPLALCVVNPGIVAAEHEKFMMRTGGDFMVGLASLHATDDSGARRSQEWQRPAVDENGRVAIRNGLPYPVVRQTMQASSRIIGEPGRALLIFCSIILDALTARSTLPQSSLRHYMSDTAWELHEV
ncbi:DUF6602 domain-containing protein [Streptomyces sp. bgisy031]|uniref:DUF6602 domain-containing protein n=1 Tax=Streptomyces sp. bgisy031 TaxID=3413772 RepID=UPI003D7203C7